MSSPAREPVDFITTESGDDLIVAYAIPLDADGEIASLILQRTPKFEFLLPPEERCVKVSHELHGDRDDEWARRIVVDGSRVDIETSAATYRIDLSNVDVEESDDARRVLREMHRFGGFELHVR